MRQSLRWLPFPSAAAAAIAFFLPWFAISCKSVINQKKQKIAFSGYHFASGKMPAVVEGMLQVRKKLAGIGGMVMAFFKKKTAQAQVKPPRKEPDALTVLRQGFPSFWAALVCLGFASLLGLAFALQGPSRGLRIAGTLAIVVAIGCLLYPVLDRPPNLTMPKAQLKIVSVQLELGGYLLLSGIVGSLVGFWAAPSGSSAPQDPQSPLT